MASNNDNNNNNSVDIPALKKKVADRRAAVIDGVSKVAPEWRDEEYQLRRIADFERTACDHLWRTGWENASPSADRFNWLVDEILWNSYVPRRKKFPFHNQLPKENRREPRSAVYNAYRRERRQIIDATADATRAANSNVDIIPAAADPSTTPPPSDPASLAAAAASAPATTPPADPDSVALIAISEVSKDIMVMISVSFIVVIMAMLLLVFTSLV